VLVAPVVKITVRLDFLRLMLVMSALKFLSLPAIDCFYILGALVETAQTQLEVVVAERLVQSRIR
jgi:hypothetical protein